MKTRFLLGFMLVCAVPCLVGGAALASAYSDFNAGIAAHNRDDWDEALKRMNAALGARDFEPSFHTPALIDRADAHFAKKEWDLAIADYTAALNLSSGNLEARVRRAAVEHQTKKYDAAIADFGVIVRLRPSLVLGYQGRALCNDEAGYYDAAIADYTTIIGMDPKDAQLFALRGNAYRHKRDFDHALADLSAAITMTGVSSTLYFDRAQVYQDQGDYTRAIADEQMGLKYRAGDIDGYMQLGLSQWAGGHFSDAATSFQKVVQGRPAFAYGALWRALSQGHNHDSYDAEFAANAVKFDAKWPAPVVKLYLGQAAAETVIPAAADKDPDTNKNQVCEAEFYTAEWQILHGNQGAAMPLLAAARDNCPTDFVERDAAIAEIARLQ